MILYLYEYASIFIVFVSLLLPFSPSLSLSLSLPLYLSLSFSLFLSLSLSPSFLRRQSMIWSGHGSLITMVVTMQKRGEERDEEREGQEGQVSGGRDENQSCLTTINKLEKQSSCKRRILWSTATRNRSEECSTFNCYSPYFPWTIQCTAHWVYRVHYTRYTMHYTVYRVYSIVYSTHYTLYTMHYAVYTI